jgi:hypothetical protein
MGLAAETRNQIPPSQLPLPQKMTGIGTAHMRITATPEAQMWFNQGLNLLHDFWDYESARAFEQSVRVDPQCAMCYWGLAEALAFYHSTERGYAPQALAKAVSLKKHASKRERLYIEATAAEQQDRENARRGVRSSQSVALWRKLVKKYPKDTEARIFLARLVSHKESVALLESVLKQDPNNSAANHLYSTLSKAPPIPKRLFTAQRSWRGSPRLQGTSSTCRGISFSGSATTPARKKHLLLPCTPTSATCASSMSRRITTGITSTT